MVAKAGFWAGRPHTRGSLRSQLHRELLRRKKGGDTNVIVHATAGPSCRACGARKTPPFLCIAKLCAARHVAQRGVVIATVKLFSWAYDPHVVHPLRLALGYDGASVFALGAPRGDAGFIVEGVLSNFPISSPFVTMPSPMG